MKEMMIIKRDWATDQVDQPHYLQYNQPWSGGVLRN